MAAHSFFGGELRPDQERYARMAGGMSSPLWIPFMAAASMGAAWWMMQNWPKLASGVSRSGDGADGNGRTNSLAAQPVEGTEAAARTFDQDVAAPVTESLAVQGADDAEAAPALKSPRTAAAPEVEPSAPKKTPRKPAAASSGQDPAVSKLLAAAAHPEPELPPHEGLPARKKGGGKGKKNGG